MAIYTEIPVIDAASQRLSTTLAQRQIDLALDWNAYAGRWALSIAVDGEVRDRGRRIVLGSNLFQALGSDFGELRAVDWGGAGAQPGRAELPAGAVRLIHRAED